MKLTDTLEGLGRPVAYHPGLARMTGSVKAAIFLGQLIYWWPRRNGDTVYKTAEDWEAETALTDREQRSARTTLKNMGIITEDYRRLKHQMHYILHEDALNECWERFANGQNSNSRTTQTADPELTKAQVGNEQKRKSSYIHRLHTETTTENTSVQPAAVSPPKERKLPAQKDDIAALWESRLTRHTPFDTWKNIGMQRSNAKRLAEATRRLMQVDSGDSITTLTPEEVVDSMMQLYLETKRTAKAEYWRDAPVTPAAVYARWEQLVEKAKQAHTGGANENVMREVVW